MICADDKLRNIAAKIDLQEIRGVKGEEVMMRRASKSEREKIESHLFINGCSLTSRFPTIFIGASGRARASAVFRESNLGHHSFSSFSHPVITGFAFNYRSLALKHATDLGRIIAAARSTHTQNTRNRRVLLTGASGVESAWLLFKGLSCLIFFF